MATYAIGDIQGCMGALDRLLLAIRFDPCSDRIWLVGDLVNRGERSADVLRWAKGQGDRVVTVLGNHDLHLLARALVGAPARRRDTLEDVLGASDRTDLVAWLRHQPLLHREAVGGRTFVLLHAGLFPTWSIAQAEAKARAAEAVLRGSQAALLLRALAMGTSSGEPRIDECNRTLAVLTRLRTCYPDGSACLDYSGPPEGAPADCVPWFAMPNRCHTDVTIVAGHWAALGLRNEPDLITLDTGCVWGDHLTAIRLEDREVFQVPAKGSGRAGGAPP